jgi:hypothetical protein
MRPSHVVDELLFFGHNFQLEILLSIKQLKEKPYLNQILRNFSRNSMSVKLLTRDSIFIEKLSLEKSLRRPQIYRYYLNDFLVILKSMIDN